MANRRALVVFGKALPPLSRDIDVVVAAHSLEAEVVGRGLFFISLEDLLLPGNIKKSAEMAHELSLMKTSDGRRISKLLIYEGYELWWIHYDDLFYRFLLPYTQYKKLLDYLKDFSEVRLVDPPCKNLFVYYLRAHGRDCRVSDPKRRHFSFGLLLQLGISVVCLPWLMVRRPKLMVWTGDLFDGNNAYDFRFRHIYEELAEKNLVFVEFIRSMESSGVVVARALRRKRAAMYSYAITILIRRFANFAAAPLAFIDDRAIHASPEDYFRYSIATHYLRMAKGDIWSIRLLCVLLRCIGIKVAFITNASARQFCEVLACKILNIPIVGILHGVASRHYNVADFMPGFDGEKKLSVDLYGVWSQWWKEYYLQYSRAYAPEQLFVSGPMRPAMHNTAPAAEPRKGLVKVLFVSEQLAAPMEALPYLEALLNENNIDLYIKFRSSGDGFETWLKENRPDILSRLKASAILRGSMGDAVAHCDMAVGSHSTGVLEALMQNKPCVLYHTDKWGDYFDLLLAEDSRSFFAQNPLEFIRLIHSAESISFETISVLRERFFGDPHKNGSAWVIRQAEAILEGKEILKRDL